jgi:light-regulated signal transduction histidine kinase (bacteriophytochrome)
MVIEQAVIATPEHTVQSPVPSHIKSDPFSLHSNLTSPSSDAHTACTSMDLSKPEQSMILQMREAMHEERTRLVDSLTRAEDVQRALVSENRYLVAWNEDLIGALNANGIDIPCGPESQYPGTASTYDYN